MEKRLKSILIAVITLIILILFTNLYSQDKTKYEIGVTGSRIFLESVPLSDNQSVDNYDQNNFTGFYGLFVNGHISKYFKTGIGFGYSLFSINRETETSESVVNSENTYNLYSGEFTVAGVFPLHRSVSISLNANYKYLLIKSIDHVKYDTGNGNFSGSIDLYGDSEGFMTYNQAPGIETGSIIGMELSILLNLSRRLSLVLRCGRNNFTDSIRLKYIKNITIENQNISSVEYGYYSSKLQYLGVSLLYRFGSMRF